MFNLSSLFSKFLSIFNDIRYWIDFATSNRKMFALFVLVVVVALCFYLTDTTEEALLWSFAILLTLGALWGIVHFWRRRKARKASAELGDAIEAQVSAIPSGNSGDMKGLKERLLQAVRTIKTSKIGQVSGSAALYELPWYIIIGNPSAGKSSAITNSGLKFPLADQAGPAIRGIGGTRDCDWFFTTEGILLDTAGRYSVHEEKENHTEWLGFLGLLKKHRPQAPINGIIVAASIGELMGKNSEFGIELAKNLRQRIQELTDKLGVFTPIYVIFTKADLIAGFGEFFADADERSCARVWGATLPYNANGASDAVALFDKHFDVLHQGLKELSTAQIAAHSKDTLPSGMFTFPLEFAAIKPALRVFLATLFEQNPYQHKPIFRGFYFTSALQEGQAQSSEIPRLQTFFGLQGHNLIVEQTEITAKHGFFIKDLFSKVIFADKHLVLQHTQPGRLKFRYAAFFGMIAGLGLLFGAWIWAYYGNIQLARNVQADLETVIEIQKGRTDMESRLEAMEILQARIEQLENYGANHTLSLGIGLYQGDKLKKQLLAEYYHGLRQFMVDPVKTSLEDFLAQVDLSALSSGQATPIAVTSDLRFKDASPHNAEDVRNALKAYLMMDSKGYVEPNHLADQITRFWRGWLEKNRGGMSRDKLIDYAGHMVSFYTARAHDADWPEIQQKPLLVEKVRSNLRSVMRGMPARERVYATIKARATARYASMTVVQIVGESDSNLLMGSYALPGAFTRQAWSEYIEPSFREASKKELQTTDWVLGVTRQDDLTLEGSPEQIFKSLSDIYKTEYVDEWRKFLRGVSVKPFPTFPQAVEGMNRLGNPQMSPLRKLLLVAFEQTAWDNPTVATNASPGWFKRTILRQGTPEPQQLKKGIVGEQFSDIARLVAENEGQSVLGSYMEALSAIRGRFNQIKNEGDPGAGSLKFMSETLEGKGSELADALRLVDEQILYDLTGEQRDTLRPLLVRPIFQSYAAIIPTAEMEINKIWKAQVYDPFNKTLLPKYPFNLQGGMEASRAEIASIFGAEGAISRFVTTTLTPFAQRRGNILTSRTWGDLGISFQPVFTANFAQWISNTGGGSSDQQGQIHFRIQPKPASGATEYTITIDGQVLRYRNTASQWADFIWPYPQGGSGAQIKAVAFDGQNVTILNEPGYFGLEKMLHSPTAKRTPIPNEPESFNISWEFSGVVIPVTFKVISNTLEVSPDGQGGRRFANLRLPDIIVGSASAPTQTPRVSTANEESP
jgi:type VI secretion system protein ImpL